MKNHYIFIEFDATIRFDFSIIANPACYSLYLIVSRKNFATLSQASLYSFREVITIDDAEFTFDNILSIVKNIIGKFQICAEELGIITHDEYSIGVAAKIRETLRVAGDSYQRIAPFTDKVLMKQAIPGLRTPKYLRFLPLQYKEKGPAYIDEIINNLGLPVFIKPLSRASCFETSEIHSREAFFHWLKDHSNRDSFEIDEYVRGKLYHCDSIVENGQIKKIFICEYNNPCADFMKGKPLGSISLMEDHPFFKEFSAYNKKVLQAINIPDNTVTHFEFFRKQDGELIFLEIANRAPGGEIPFVYHIMTGKNLEEILVRLQMQLPVDLNFKQPEVFSAFIRFPKIRGIVASLSNPDITDIKSHYSIRRFVQVGDKIEQAANLSDSAIIMVLWNRDYGELSQDFANLSNRLPYEIEALAEVTI